MGCVIDFFDGGLALWLVLLLSHLLFVFKKDRTIPHLVICVSHGTCNTEVCPEIGLTLGLYSRL
jgi:hypothetical protein